MNDWSRRNMLRASAGAAIAVPMAALGSSVATAAERPAQVPDSFGDVAGPVMFCVHDAQRGEVSILHGTTEVIVQDRQLVARILSAAAHHSQA